jgi:CheY-like chemotaxis protein
LLNDILDLSKIEAGKMDLRQEPVSLREMLEDVCRMFSLRIEEKNIELCLEVGPAVPGLVLVDPVRLRQILLNLIGNAVKFTEAGQVRVCVHAQDMQGQEGGGRDIILSVQDTGIGIPEDALEMIFEPFEQQKGPVMKGYGGTGLGLSITRSLVESMGGRIRVESRVGEGSVFTVELPVAEAAKGELEQKGEPGRREYAEVRFRQALVLVVDDIDYNREIIRGFYDGFNIEVEEAENGYEALEKARQRKPDLILLDIKMPGMDGYEFMRVLKTEKALRDIPVIAVTAHALKEEEMRIRAICQGYMCKPLRCDDLIRETMQYVPYTLQGPAQDVPVEAEIGEAERACLVAGLPDELVHALNRAADMADVGRMRELIGEVKKIDERLGALLAGYADSYNYNGIGEVLKGGKQ